MTFRNLLLLALIPLQMACTPEELVWDLPRTNPLDNESDGSAIPFELCASDNCSNLNTVTTQLTGGPSWESWGTGTGHTGEGFVASHHGFIEFEFSVNQNFRVRFWLSSFEAGYWEHDVPQVTWNGIPVSTEVFSGNNQGGDGDDWVQRQSDLLIASSGNGTGILRIQFPEIARTYSRKLDEVELWCLP